MFQQFRNIDYAFKLCRIITIITLIDSVIFCLLTVYLCHRHLREKEKEVLVIANGKIFQAFAEDHGKYWDIEAKDHVKTFHSLFFTLQPDETFITKNITKALYLIDNTGKAEYDNLQESGYFTAIIAANVSQVIESEQVEVNLNTNPWYFRYSGKLRIVRASNIVTRSLITEGFIRVTTPSDNNPHGFLIERWRILENKDIDSATR